MKSHTGCRARCATHAAAIAIILQGLGCSGDQHPAIATAAPAIAAVDATPSSPTYEIRMHRDAAVGQRGRLVAVGERQRSRQIRANGRIVQDQRESVRVRFEAVERVISIDEHGKSLQVEYTIDRFEVDGTHGVTALLSAGQVLTLVRGAKEGHVTVDGQAVAEPVRSALAVVVSMTASEVTDDDVFGTAQRQAPGAVWPVHGDVAARDIASNVGVEPTISGSTHLIQRTTFQSIDCLQMSVEMSGSFNSFPGLPPGAVVRVGTINWAFEGMLPLDPALPKLSSRSRVQTHVVADLQTDAQSKELEQMIDSRRDESFAPL